MGSEEIDFPSHVKSVWPNRCRGYICLFCPVHEILLVRQRLYDRLVNIAAWLL